MIINLTDRSSIKTERAIEVVIYIFTNIQK